MSLLKTWIAGMLIVCCLASYAEANQFSDEEAPSAAVVIVDVVPIRIISLAATMLGGALFVATLPFTAFVGPGEAFDSLVKYPAQYTFTRPLGQFYNWQEEEGDIFPVRKEAPRAEPEPVQVPTTVIEDAP